MKLTTMVRENVGLRPPDCVRWGAFVVLCLFAGAFNVCAQDAEAPDSAASAEEQWVPMGEEALADLVAAPSAEERAALLASGDEAALQAALDAANSRVEQLADAMPAIHRDIREFRQKAMRDSDKAKEIRAQIQSLEDELATWVDEQPEIRERRDALDAINRNMMDELRFRRELNRKLGRGIARPLPSTQPILEP